MKPRLPDPSSPVAPYISAFLAHKRALNRKYHVEEMAFRLLDHHLNRVGIKTLAEVTPEVLNTFFLGRPRNRPRSFNHLVGVVGRLFEWMVEHEIIDRSPVTTRLRRPGRTRPPCIFDLPTAQRLEERSMLTIRDTKFSKSRLVPMGPQLARRVVTFLAMRAERAGRLLADDPVFSFTGGRAVNPGTISQTFHKLIPKLGLSIAEGERPPTAHHLRHSFAVGRLLRWYRDDGNPTANLMKLSTFMGHVDPTSTAIYLTITAQLLDAAARRFERFAAPLSRGGRP
jgi:hypothetical protein